MRTTDSEHPSPAASDTGVRPAAEPGWLPRFRIGLLVVTAGAVVWQLSVPNNLVFPDVPDANLADTAAERAELIQEQFTQWRVAWFLAMIGRVLIGAGLVAVGGALMLRETARRRQAAQAIVWLGATNIPLGIARFGITLGDAEFAAAPGLWFDALWVLHFFGTAIALVLLIWLTYRNPAPRWSAVALALSIVPSLAIIAPVFMYSPGLLLYGAATAWRVRRSASVDHAT